MCRRAMRAHRACAGNDVGAPRGRFGRGGGIGLGPGGQHRPRPTTNPLGTIDRRPLGVAELTNAFSGSATRTHAGPAACPELRSNHKEKAKPMKLLTRTALFLATVAIATAALAACSDSSMPGLDHGNMPNTSAVSATANTADVQFAQMMIPHHAQAVEMADLAATKASDPELKAISATIKSAQQPEIDTMTGWLKAWNQPTAQPGGHDMPGMGSMPGMMSEQDMSALRAASGVDFDRQFAR